MALEFFDPTSEYANGTQIFSLWNGVNEIKVTGIAATNNGTWVPSNTGRFAGTTSISVSSVRGDACAAGYINLANVATRFASVSGNYASGTGTDHPIIAFYDTTTPQISICLNATGKIEINRNGTILATSSASYTFGNWHRVEVECTVNSSTGFVEVHMDGVLSVNFTGNTQASGNAYSNVVYFGNGQTSGSSANLTDFLIYTATGSAPNGFLGDKRIYSNLPTTNGTTQNYTVNIAAWPSATAVALGTTILDSNGNTQRVTSISGTGTTGASHPTWATTLNATTTDNPGGNQVVWTLIQIGSPSAFNVVNDVPPDGDFSYLSSSTAGDIELFGYPVVPSSITGIVGIGFIIYSRKDDAATRTLRGFVNSGGTTADSGVDLAQLTSYAFYEGFFPTDPNTGVSWTASGVNAVQLGTKTTA